MSLYPMCHATILIAVILRQVLAVDDCNSTYSSGVGLQCYPCGPGNITIGDCVENLTRAECEKCQEGTFQSECVKLTNNGTVSCKPCTVCDVYEESCTLIQDAVCETGGITTKQLIALLIFGTAGGLYVVMLSCLAIDKIYRRMKPNISDGKTRASQGNAYDPDQRNVFTVETFSEDRSRRTENIGLSNIYRQNSPNGLDSDETIPKQRMDRL
ncbi:uncharacterized protein LOC132720918 isoform X2 [Ruditapes philippinarum]|nr:uncharacterized protein LOC132720918 isoform X2 [Ruditapes philippinarum]XP_060561135.1 uncharacterized protein LOC132720918 isoform X2 [Ruditapes philippinarum]XP_060561136.1 uncharacterized protein LOC132720918 isoform X2 [Ruditapes philippinarum]